MAQKYFSAVRKEYDLETRDKMLEVIKVMSIRIRQQIKGRKTLEELLIHPSPRPLASKDMTVPQKPEIFTINEIVKPLLKSLGYGEDDRIDEAHQELNDKAKWVDFALIVNNKKILVEVEPLNKNLERKGCGIDQIKKL